MNLREYAAIISNSNDADHIERCLNEIATASARTERAACALIVYEAYRLLSTCPDGDDCCGRAVTVDIANAMLSRGRNHQR